MTKGGVMVLDSSGCFWLETIDDVGERHWSYCGKLGYVPAVRAWCESKGIKLVDMAWQNYVRKLPASLCQP